MVVSFHEFTTVILCQSPALFLPRNIPARGRGDPQGLRRRKKHCWTGARESAERCLVLKWIPPVFVGGASADIVTIHPVKGGQP